MRVRAVVAGWVLALLGALVPVLAPTSATAAPVQQEPAPLEPAPTPSGPTTLVLGDSLTFWARHDLRRLHPDWTIDARRGRPVNLLPLLLTVHRAREGTPRRVVIALGTNPSRGWSGDAYRAVLATLPATTGVWLVTPYRDPRRFPSSADAVTGYARAMNAIDAEFANVHVVPWRYRVTTGQVGLRDGVHALRGVGERYWADLVSDAVAGRTA